jgi:hypothetical protein
VTDRPRPSAADAERVAAMDRCQDAREGESVHASSARPSAPVRWAMQAHDRDCAAERVALETLVAQLQVRGRRRETTRGAASRWAHIGAGTAPASAPGLRMGLHPRGHTNAWACVHVHTCACTYVCGCVPRRRRTMKTS